jgi:hypothetical protein
MNTLAPTIRVPRFAQYGNGGVNFRSREAIPLDQIATIAPSVFAEAKHSSRSDRYSLIPTREVLQLLDNNGFRVFSVSQGGSRDEEKKGFTKHLLRLRHESMMVANVGDSIPEIVLLNSHDGTSSYQLMAGLFRLVCSNGLVVASASIEDIRIPHKGDVAQRVLDGCVTVIERLPTVADDVKRFGELVLSRPEQEAFATAALVARYGESEAPIKPVDVLAVRRNQDAAPTLWNTLNTVQENVIRGGLNYVQRDQVTGRVSARRRTREVKGVDGNVNTNRALWTLAQELAKLKV